MRPSRVPWTIKDPARQTQSQKKKRSFQKNDRFFSRGLDADKVFYGGPFFEQLHFGGFHLLFTEAVDG